MYWGSAFRLFRAADMLKQELQRLTFVKEKTLGNAGHRISIRLPKSWPYRNKPFMRFFRRNRFALIFFVLLIFCSAMVVRQFMANQSRHVELREYFILLYSKGYREEAERLFKRLMRELETLPNKALMDDYQRTLMLVDPAKEDRDNFILRYHLTVSKELDKRSEGTLQRALKMAEEEGK